MPARPLSTPAPWAALLFVLTPVAALPAPPGGGAGAVELVQLQDRMTAGVSELAADIDALRSGRSVQDVSGSLDPVLAALPAELDRYRDLRAQLGQGADAELVSQLQDELQQAAQLESSLRQGGASAGPARLPDRLGAVRSDLSELLGSSASSLGAPDARAYRNGHSGQAPGAGAAQRSGAGLVQCAGGFDGAGCGAASPRSNLGPGPAPASPAAALAASGTRGRTAVGSQVTSPAASGKSFGTAGGKPDSARVAVTRPTITGGANPRLDQGEVPPMGPSGPGAVSSQVPGQDSPPSSLAAGSSAASPQTQGCLSAVDGSDPAHPQHSSIARMCVDHPTVAPLLAGLMDAVSEQFGTVQGVILNLVFLVVGLLMSVATGGAALVLKLVGLIGASWAIYRLVAGMVSAAAIYAGSSAPEDRAAALRRIGQAGGTLLIMVAMALAGYGLGKLGNPGAAQVKTMGSALAGAADKAGAGGLLDKIPPPVLAALEKLFGKAPEEASPEARPAESSAGEARLPDDAATARSAVETVSDAKLDGVIRQSGLTGKIAAKITPAARDQVANDLRAIVAESLGESSGPSRITGAQYNRMLRAITEYAAEAKTDTGKGITLQRASGLKGVYPKGLNLIKYKGFGLVDDEAAEVSGAKIHELAHLFHTVQMRATLIASGVPQDQAEAFLNLMEDGVNYSNLEYFATEIGKPGGGTEAGRVGGLFGDLINATQRSLAVGRVDLPAGVPIEKGYAYWATRIVPAVCGKSPSELVFVRMPFYYFSYYYATNSQAAMRMAAPPAQTFQCLELPATAGFRDFVDASMTRAGRCGAR